MRGGSSALRLTPLGALDEVACFFEIAPRALRLGLAGRSGPRAHLFERLAVDRDECRVEGLVGITFEPRAHEPVVLRDEGVAFALTIDDQAKRRRLNPPSAQSEREFRPK